MCNDYRIILHRLCQISRNCVSINDFRLGCRLEKLLLTLFFFLDRSGFAWTWWHPVIANSCATTAHRDSPPSQRIWSMSLNCGRGADNSHNCAFGLWNPCGLKHASWVAMAWKPPNSSRTLEEKKDRNWERENVKLWASHPPGPHFRAPHVKILLESPHLSDTFPSRQWHTK